MRAGLSVEWDDLLAHRSDLRQWLGSAQPAGEAAANWWLAVALIATERVQSAVTQGNMPDGITLGTAVQAINIATDDGTVGRADRAVRLANLAGLIAAAGQDLEEPRELRPDGAARECLEVLAAQGVREELVAGEGRPLSVERMRELRRVKNLVTPLGRLLPYLKDALLVDEATKWLTVHPQLP